MEEIKINEGFCFKPNRNLTASEINQALISYVENFEEAVQLSGNMPIFIDTNILLGYYGMSSAQKEKLLNFFELCKDRIVISKQVEKEYLRNRLSSINKDFFQPLKDITNDFDKIKTNIKNQLKEYRDKKKNILSQDFPDLWDTFRSIDEEVTNIIERNDFSEALHSRIQETTLNNKNLAIVDELLKIVVL